MLKANSFIDNDGFYRDSWKAETYESFYNVVISCATNQAQSSAKLVEASWKYQWKR